MDIFINGKQGAGKTRAAEAIVAELEGVHKNKAHLYAYYPDAIRTVALLREELRMARTRVVVFDGCILNGVQLLIAVQAVKEFREQVNADILAIYVQQAEAVAVKDVAERMPMFKGDLSPYATGGKLIDTLDKVTTEQVAKMHQDWRYSFNAQAGGVIGVDVAAIAGTDKATLTYLAPEGEDVTATHRRYPLTWDNKRSAFEAADLEADGQVVCSAVNVYAFEGLLKDGSGKRAKRFMLFELAEVNPVSKLHVAVDKMNTHYFETGRHPRRAFNAKHVRPATPSEVLEYLNAKYQYEKRNKS